MRMIARFGAFAMRAIYALIGAIGFLTLLPMPSRIACDTQVLNSAPIFFPLVGLLLGAIVACIDHVMLKILPISAASGITVIVLVMLTGGLHLDGVGDLADALASQADAKRKLEIMREPYIGAFGAIAIVSVLLLKYALLVELTTAIRWKVIIMTPMIARWSVLLPISGFAYAHADSGMGSAFRPSGYGQWMVAMIYTCAVTWALGGFTITAITLTLGITALALSYPLAQHLNGLSGDCYGAIIELTEVASLFLLCIGGG